jgi:resuscitation-promoting factor RpfE
MEHTPHHRFTQAEIVMVFVLMVAFASTAWAEVSPVGNSSLNGQLSFNQAAALAAEPHGVKIESQKLRVHLVKQKREDRREARRTRRRLLAKREAAAASRTSPSSYSGSGRADWYATASCESGQRWSLNTGNGYWGGLQFSPSTWFSNGGGPFDGSGPFPYSAADQIRVAENVLASQGPGAWPNCFHWA